MKQRKKRFLALFLCLTMVMSFMPTAAFAQEDDADGEESAVVELQDETNDETEDDAEHVEESSTDGETVDTPATPPSNGVPTSGGNGSPAVDPEKGENAMTEDNSGDAGSPEDKDSQGTGGNETVAPSEDLKVIEKPTISDDNISDTPYVGYDTLADAFDNARDGSKIVLSADEELTDTHIVISDKTLTLDLNGKTITTDGKELFTVSGNGNLTITGDGKIVGPEGEAGAALDGKAILVVSGENATLTVENGTITAGGDGSDGMYGIYIAKGGSVVLGDEKGNGPTITTWFAPIGENHTTATANVTVYGGTYTELANPVKDDGTVNKWSYFCAPIYAACAGNIDIQGGTFNGYYAISSRYKDMTQNVTISGGTFKGSAAALFVDNVDGKSGEASNRSISVTGGTFSTDPSAYVPEGYSAVEKDGSFAVEYTAVAEVNGQGYNTVSAAIRAAGGSTVTLVKDVTEYIYVPVNVSAALDLNGHTLTLPGESYLANLGTLAVKNGTITSVADINRAVIVNYGTLTLDDSLTIETGTRYVGVLNVSGELVTAANIKGDCIDELIAVRGGEVTVNGGQWTNTYRGTQGYCLYLENSVVTVKDVTASAKRGFSSNNALSESTTLTIEGGTFNLDANGVYWPATGTLTLGTDDGKGPTFNCTTGLEICSGTVVVKGGTFNATKHTGALSSADAATNYRKHSGMWGYADAVTIVANRNVSAEGTHTAYDSAQLNVTISGGTFSSAANYAVRYVDCDYGDTAAVNNYDPQVSITGGTFVSAIDFSTANQADAAAKPVTGGTFSADPSAYVAAGYVVDATEDGGFVVREQVQAVVTIRDEIEVTTDGSKPVKKPIDQLDKDIQDALNAIKGNKHVTKFDSERSVNNVMGDPKAYINAEVTGLGKDRFGINSVTYEVKPHNDDGVIANDDIRDRITFRLAIPFDAEKVDVKHEGKYFGTYPVQDGYVEIASDKFSEFELCAADESRELIASVGDVKYYVDDATGQSKWDILQEAIYVAVANDSVLNLYTDFCSGEVTIPGESLKINSHGNKWLSVYTDNVLVKDEYGQATVTARVKGVEDDKPQPATTAHYGDEVTVAVDINDDFYSAVITLKVDASLLQPKTLPDGWSGDNGTYTFSKVLNDGTEKCDGGQLGTFQFTVTGTAGSAAIEIDKTSWAAVTLADNDISASPTVNVENATVTITTTAVTLPEIQSKEYNGEPQTADVENGTGYNVTANAGGVDAGSYDVTLKLTDDTLYSWPSTLPKDATLNADGTLTLKFEITKAENEWTVGPTVTGTAYTGSLMETAGEAKFGEVKITYTDANGDTIGAPAEVGAYTATFTVEGTDNYTELKTDVPFTIGMADPIVTAPIPKDLTYNGKPQELVETGSTTGGTMVYVVSDAKPDDDVTGSEIIPTGIDAGTYTVWYKVNGNKNYNGTDWESVKVEIAKANPGAKAPTAYDGTYTGKPVDLITEGPTLADGLTPDDVQIEYKDSDGNWSTEIPTKDEPGDYTVEYRITPISDDAKKNYVEEQTGTVIARIYDDTRYIYVADKYAFGDVNEDGSGTGYSVVYVFAKGNAHYAYETENDAYDPMYDITALGYHLYGTDGQEATYGLTSDAGGQLDGDGWHVYAIPVKGVGDKAKVKAVSASIDVAGTVRVNTAAEDVTLDTIVNIRDIAAVLTARHPEANPEVVTEDYADVFFRADVNRDGIIDAVEDVALIAKAMGT